MTTIGDNSGIDLIARGQLRAFVERIERLDEEAKALNDDRKDVYAEAKGCGYDTKILKRVIAARRKDPEQREEEDAVFQTYLAALAMTEGPQS